MTKSKLLLGTIFCYPIFNLADTLPATDQKVWIYSEWEHCSEADRTDGDQADDNSGAQVDEIANDNVELVKVCFEVTRTNAEDSATVKPEMLLLHKGLDETGKEMFDNDITKITCVDIRPYAMPRITYASNDGVSLNESPSMIINIIRVVILKSFSGKYRHKSVERW